MLSFVVALLLYVDICVVQSGISDGESHSNAMKILLTMGEFFQIQVREICNDCATCHCTLYSR